MSHHNPTSESLKAFLAARERVETRRRLAALEEALGVFLHIRDQLDELEDSVDFRGPVQVDDLAQIEALGRLELDVVEKLRDLMALA